MLLFSAFTGLKRKYAKVKRPPRHFDQGLPRNQAERRGATSALRKGRATLPALLAP